MDDYLPLSEREKPESERRGPSRGAPSWIRSSVALWVRAQFPYENLPTIVSWANEGQYKRDVQYINQKLREIERVVRLQPGFNFSNGIHSGMADLDQRIEHGEDEVVLDIVDFLVSDGDGETLRELDEILQQGGTVWRTGRILADRYGLTRRVSAATQLAADEAMTGGQQHHKYLSKAWGEAYGRNPSPDSAYRDSVKAVEAASIPVVQPPQKPETLGLVIVELREHPEKFATRLTPSSSPPDSVTVVREMLQLLWKSQWDRHGVDDISVPLTVTQEEAEDALNLSVALVRWFDTGAIYRK